MTPDGLAREKSTATGASSSSRSAVALERHTQIAARASNSSSERAAALVISRRNISGYLITRDKLAGAGRCGGKIARTERPTAFRDVWEETGLRPARAD